MGLRHLAVAVGWACVASVHAAPGFIYDGNALPSAQGWQRQAQGLATEVVDGNGTAQFATATAPAASASGVQLYQYATGASNFIASIRLQAQSVNAHNPLDSALMFSLSDTNFFPFGSNTQRSNMLAIDIDRIQWADDAGGSVALDATQFHEIALRYRNGRIDVYIDADFADIAAGTAAPVLTRTLTPFAGPALVVFGDQTNDPNIDSSYAVDFVRFQDLDVVDPPASAVTAVPTVGEWGLLLLALLMAVAAIRALRPRQR